MNGLTSLACWRLLGQFKDLHTGRVSWKTHTTNDPILEDLRATREQLLVESGGTLAGLVSRLQKEQSESRRKIWVPRRTKDCTEADGQPQSDSSDVSSAP